MRVIIVGAGEVGSSIAASLADKHHVVVVDTDPEVVDDLTYSLDVLARTGDGSSLETLRQAEVDDADMLIACTDDDETNLVTCSTAETIGDPFTIARVRNVNFLKTWTHSQGVFGVDFMVSTDLLTAEGIIRVVGLPAATDVAPFAEGLVRMAEFEIKSGSPVSNRTVEEADRWEALTFVALVRDGTITIPRGETVLKAGDRVIVIGRPGSVQEFAVSIVPAETPGSAEEIVVIGGSSIGYQTTRLLEERGLQPKLIEWDADRARELAEELPETMVIEHDATDAEFLVEERTEQADVVVAALDSDEKNLLVSLLAKSIGAKRTVAVVESGEYTDLFERVGVDVAINPREATSEEIIRHTQERQVENLSLIEDRQAEVLEVEVDDESVLTGQPIREAVKNLPSDVVIGAITRRGEFVVPRGDTDIAPGDTVVLFMSAAVVEDVTAVV